MRVAASHSMSEFFQDGGFAPVNGHDNPVSDNMDDTSLESCIMYRTSPFGECATPRIISLFSAKSE